MIARGELFADGDPRRFELILGEIVEMPVESPFREFASDLLAEWSHRNVPADQVRIRIKGGVDLSNVQSLPLPAALWLKDRDYSKRWPDASEVLVIEISDSTLSKDRNAKLLMYGTAGVPESWIANIPGRRFEAHRDPGPGGYASRTVFGPGESIRPLALPKISFPISTIFPEATP